MATDLSVEAAGPELRDLLQHLPPGEQVNLVDSDGKRVAVVFSVRRGAEKPMPIAEWLAEWDALAEEISKAWKSDKSAVEIISEMRR